MTFEEIINNEKPTLIDFYADWCGPCKALAPIIQEVKDELGDKARVIKINIDKNPELSTKLGIQSIPALKIYKAGKMMWSGVGMQSKHFLVSKIEEL